MLPSWWQLPEPAPATLARRGPLPGVALSLSTVSPQTAAATEPPQSIHSTSTGHGGGADDNGPNSLHIECVDTELTAIPVMAFFKIAVKEPSSPRPHHIMKNHSDILDLHDAMVRELGGPGGRSAARSLSSNVGVADMLPQAPPPRPEAELATVAFRSEFNKYLSRLARSRDALDTYAFKNFFQLSDEYQRSDIAPTAPSSAPDIRRISADDSIHRCSLSHKVEDGLLEKVSLNPTCSLGQGMQTTISQNVTFPQHQPPRQRLQERPQPQQQTPLAGSAHGPTTSFTVRVQQPEASAMATSTPMNRVTLTPFTSVRAETLGCETQDSLRVPVTSGAGRLGAGTRLRALAAPAFADGTTLQGRAGAVVASNSGGFQAPFGVGSSSYSGQPASGGYTAGHAEVAAPAHGVAFSGPFGAGRPNNQTEGQCVTQQPLLVRDGTSFGPSDQGSSFGSDRISSPNASGISVSGISGMSSLPGGLSTGSKRYQSGKHRSRRRPYCVICMERPQEMAIDPCGHLSMCQACCSKMTTCPVCRGPIQKALRIFAA